MSCRCLYPIPGTCAQFQVTFINLDLIFSGEINLPVNTAIIVFVADIIRATKCLNSCTVSVIGAIMFIFNALRFLIDFYPYVFPTNSGENISNFQFGNKIACAVMPPVLF